MFGETDDSMPTKDDPTKSGFGINSSSSKSETPAPKFISYELVKLFPNALEENLQENNYNVTEDSPTKIKVEILYMDVVKTQTNLSVFHRNSDAVVIRMRGQIIQDDKVKKTAIVEESAEEVFLGTVIIDEGGKFNNENLSSALKKCSTTLIDKLLK